jgi:hypothetical protein
MSRKGETIPRDQRPVQAEIKLCWLWRKLILETYSTTKRRQRNSSSLSQTSNLDDSFKHVSLPLLPGLAGRSRNGTTCQKSVTTLYLSYKFTRMISRSPSFLPLPYTSIRTEYILLDLPSPPSITHGTSNSRLRSIILHGQPPRIPALISIKPSSNSWNTYSSSHFLLASVFFAPSQTRFFSKKAYAPLNSHQLLPSRPPDVATYL